jgi:cation:H+ antiporter
MEKVEEVKTSLSVVYIIGGIIGLFIGGKLIVDSATDIARFFNLSEAFIGLTIVALGTSLPELAASLVAAKKKHTDMAIGNVIGSNIFNILWVLAISAIIHPIDFNPMINFDIIYLIFASILLFPLIFIGKKYSISRREGIALIAFYIFYISFISFRG